jgi:hypothetical protein
VSCSTTPHVTLTGTIVNHNTGAGVPGTKIDLRVTDAGGSTTETSTTTDGAGVWQATSKLQTSGKATAFVSVTAPNDPTYTVTVPVETSTKEGDATALGLWTEVPYIRQLLSVLVSSQPLAGAVVHFEPTSGPAILDSQPDATTNSAGVFEIRFATASFGLIGGVLTITHQSLSAPIVVTELRMQPDYHFAIANVTGTILR